MNIYFAGGENKSWLDAINKAKGTKSLYSYFYLDKDNKDNKDNFFMKAKETQRFIFLDSGGYSAKTKGVEINIDEYADFIKKHKNNLTTYANLDVIGDAEATMKNQRYLESKGLNPLPVFHYREPFEVLKNLCEEYKYIAIGGLVPLARQKDKLKNFLDKCFSITKTNVKVHGFGMTGVEILKRYPFYSCDSTSWLGGSMRAEIYKFNQAQGKMITIKTNDKNTASYKSINFTDNKDKRWLSRVINNAQEWIKFEQYITNLWKARGIEWKN